MSTEPSDRVQRRVERLQAHKAGAVPSRCRPEWEEYIKRAVDEAPPLSDEQRDRLAALFAGEKK